MCNACGCDTTTTSDASSDASAETTYLVEGMTCSHCVASVREEVGEIAGVTVVDVELESGKLVVSGEAAGDRDAIRAAVEAAGYQVAPS